MRSGRRVRVSVALAVTALLVVLGAMGSAGLTAEPSEEPHGITSANTDFCDTCHSLHGAQSDRLGGQPSANEICFACHDGTVGSDIQTLYESTDTYAGHRTETSGTVPPGSALNCVACHKPHGYISRNGFLMRSSYFTEQEGTKKRLEATTTRDFRDICVICHEIEAARPRTRLLGIDISNLATDTGADIAHRPGQTVYCKLCHNLAGDAEAAHSPTLATGLDTTEAEAINLAGVDTTDSSASAGTIVIFSGNEGTTVLEWTDPALTPGRYRVLLRAQCESTSTRFTGRINSVESTAAYQTSVNAWGYLDLGDFITYATTDDFALKVENSSDATSLLDRVYFLKYR